MPDVVTLLISLVALAGSVTCLLLNRRAYLDAKRRRDDARARRPDND